MKKQISKIIKIAIGCCISGELAALMGLENYTSAAIITLLSIQNTKKETILLASKRGIAFVVAVIMAWISFNIIGYNVFAFGLYLLFFIGFCQYYKLQDGISVCSVLVTHFWTAQEMTLPLLWNEALLLVIGAGVGIIINLFLPRQLSHIKQLQREIEDLIKTVLNAMADTLTSIGLQGDIESLMTELESTLDFAYTAAQDNMKNTLINDMRYYVQYIDLRQNQYDVLEKVLISLGKIEHETEQALILADFFRHASDSFHEYNNASELLNDVRGIKEHFRETTLPKTREEFEARAILFQILNDIEHLIILKSQFAKQLTEEQKTLFWSEVIE